MRLITGILGFIWKLYIGVIFVITALLFYPIIVPFLFSDKGKKKAFRLFVTWSWIVRVLGCYRVRKLQQAELPEAPYLIIGNHASYLDIFLMPSIMPQNEFLFLGKSEILKYPLIKTYFKRLNIPVYRDNNRKAARSIIQALNEVKKGWSIVIFPEGGIPDEHNPKMIPFKRGAFILAKQGQLPIVPMTFLTNCKLFSDPGKLLGPARPGVSEVIIHPVVTLETVNELSHDELKDHCFGIVNGPIKERYPDLYE